MRKLILIILFAGFFQIVFGQERIDSLNKMVKRILQNNISVPEYEETSSSGLTLIKLSKVNDSILVNSLFCSAEEFNVANDKSLIRSLNRYYKNKLPNNYEVFVALYFTSYNSKGSLVPYPQGSEEMLKLKLRLLKKRNVLNPVIIVAFPLQR